MCVLTQIYQSFSSVVIKDLQIFLHLSHYFESSFISSLYFPTTVDLHANTLKTEQCQDSHMLSLAAKSIPIPLATLPLRVMRLSESISVLQ